MKRIYFLWYCAFLIAIPLSGAYSQVTIYKKGGGTWTWISGDSTGNSTGVYGTQGMPSANNHPPGLYEPCEWKDKQGNFWIFGGVGLTQDFYSDLWKFNPLTKEWTWVKGNGSVNEQPIYGALKVPNLANTPGARSYAVTSWVDTSGALWLFGGAEGSYIDSRNDLWKYDIATNQWTWMNGTSTLFGKGVHGVKGIAGALNTPGARDETCSAWTDSLNNLWLFGGYGYDENGSIGYLNDLCKYDISANEWTWMKGSAYAGATASYGIKEVNNINNDPGARFTHTKWKDTQGNFWLMGGYNTISLNDVWKYDVSVNNWIWMGGTAIANDSGNYMINCVFDTLNLPFSKMEQRATVTDNCGRFWYFGGANLYSAIYNNLNDLWVFDPQQLKWNWVNGTNVPNQPGYFGALNVPSSSNVPPSCMGSVAWWGIDNKFYMFGGLQKHSSGTAYCYSDVWVFDPDTNCIPVCGQVVLYPNANFQTSDTSLCTDDCINFFNLSANAISWQWSFPGAIDSISTAQNPQNICYLKPGTYNVTLIASNATGSDSVTFTNYINVKPSPPTPVISQHHDTLYCSTDPSYTSYQWFDDTTLIPGATDTSLVITHGGNYNMQVKNSNNCQVAVGITVVLGIQNYDNNDILSISPNPAGSELTITNPASGGTGSELKIKAIAIYNVLGQNVFSEQSEIINRKSEISIDVSSLSSGLYFVRAVTESGQWIGRFVKE